MAMVDISTNDYGQRKKSASAEVPKTARWTWVKQQADNLTKHFSVPPIPVLEIAERNGVDVVFADFGTHSQAVAGFCDFKNSRLYVNKEDRSERQFFTIAHELGHWLLHRDVFLAYPDRYPVLPRFQNVDSHSPMEQEANHFAANLLVPAHLLRPVLSAPVSSLAQIFRVSRTMMEFRVNNVR